MSNNVLIPTLVIIGLSGALMIAISQAQKPDRTNDTPAAEKQAYCLSTNNHFERECVKDRATCEKDPDGKPRHCFPVNRVFCFIENQFSIVSDGAVGIVRDSICTPTLNECMTWSDSQKHTDSWRITGNCFEAKPSEVW